MKKPMELADQLVREHADRIADTVTRVSAVVNAQQFVLHQKDFDADVVRGRNGTYYVVAVVLRDGKTGWSTPEGKVQQHVNDVVEDWCESHDDEIRLAIDAALTPDPIAAQGDGTNEDSLDADWKDGGA